MMVSQVFQPYRIPPTEEIPVKVCVNSQTSNLHIYVEVRFFYCYCSSFTKFYVKTVIISYLQVVIGDETLTFKMPPSAFKHGKPAAVSIQSPTGTIKVNIPVPASLRQVKCNDDIYNYNMNLLQWGLHIIDLDDIIKEGDIARISTALRRLYYYILL